MRSHLENLWNCVYSEFDVTISSSTSDNKKYLTVITGFSRQMSTLVSIYEISADERKKVSWQP